MSRIPIDDEGRDFVRDADGKVMEFETEKEAVAAMRVLADLWRRKQREMGLSDEWPPPSTPSIQ